MGPKDASDTGSTGQDKLYSGFYIITAIHHKVNRLSHEMIMEVVKDSLLVDQESIKKA